jgi:hypothetical protein
MITSTAGKIVTRLFVLLACLAAETGMAQDYGVNTDLQSWNTVRITHPIDEKWSVALQNEARFNDDISRLDEYVVKLYAHHIFTDKFGLSFGYKHINRPADFNETDPWAELVFPRTYNQWHVSHQVRFETRFSSELPGILPRVRYLYNWSRQLGDSSMYATGFAAIRFNLDEKGTGPVSGFEQVRATANLGIHLGSYTRFEFGYLYRFERSRGKADLSDHVLHANLFFTTKARPKPRRPKPNDHFQ